MQTRNARDIAAIAAILGLLATPAALAEFAPQLSEIMAINDSGLPDEDGSLSDWIEIHNAGDSAGDLSGWFLSDDATNLKRWEFPPTPLGPGEFLMVFASGKNRAAAGGELHTNFKLGSAGEFLALVRPGGLSAASSFDPAFPQQFGDVSWGAAGYFSQATPRAANSAAGSAPLRAVAFTPDHQIFTGLLSLTIASASAEATIIYTLDGTDPSSTNGTIYTGPIQLDTGTEIRARAQVSDAEAGPIVARKYLKLATEMLGFSSPLPIVVLDNFGAGAVPQRNASTGPNGNDGSGVIQVARQPVLLAIYDRDASGQASPSAPPAIVSDAGIRVRGSSSAALAKKPFSLETWSDGTVEQSADIAPFGMPGDSDWVLYAPTEAFSGNRYDRPLLHNSFIYQLSNEIGRYAVRTQFVEVFLNTGGGELALSDYAGLYVFMEQRKRGKNRIDFPELSRDGSAGGWMINVDRMDPVPPGGAGTPRHFHTPGPNQILETPDDSAFGLRNLDDRPEFYHSFFNFESPGGYAINAAQRGVIESAMNAFENALYGPDWRDPELGYAAWIDVDNFVDHFLLNNLTKNQDAFVLSTLIYRHGPADKIGFGPIWDFDRGYTTSPTNTNPAADLLWAADRMWYPRLFQDPDFTQRYIDRWQGLREGSLATAHLHAIIDAQRTEITGAVAARNGTADWPAKVAAMKAWLADRSRAIDAQLVPKPVFSRTSGAVPAGAEVTLSGAPGSAIYYTTDGSDPRLPGGAIAPAAIPFDGGPVDSVPVPFQSDCRFHVPADGSLGLAWSGDPDSFNDSAWTLAPSGLGWENLPGGTLIPAIQTDISAHMRGTNASAYFRWQFELDQAQNVNSLTLRVLIDDGFVAYLNGIEIGRFNAPAQTGWDSQASGSRNDPTVLASPIAIDASAFRSALRNGSNAIAIQGMNTSASGADFLIDASLELTQTVSASPVMLDSSQKIIARALDGGGWSGPAEATFAVGTTPADATNLVVSELMYNPGPPSAAEIGAGIRDGDQFEFVELMNIAGTEIDLAGVTFTDGIDFTFPGDTTSLLAPGERILVVKNLAALELRYGSAPGRRIAGEFSNDTNLRDGGEALALATIDGTPARNFTYDDAAPWPESADGRGYSLVLDIPATNPDHRLPSSWHSSAAVGGSPGSSGSVDFSGDPLADADADGLSRLLEFATGSSDASRSDPPIEYSSDPAGTISFVFRRNLAAAAIRYHVESSSDLLAWAGAGQYSGETNLGDGTALNRYQLAIPPGNRRVFLRLRVGLQ